MVNVQTHIIRFCAGGLLALASAGIAQAQLLPNLGGQRVGISAFTFLKNDISPRSLAMGGANVTTAGDAYSAANNPAALSEVRQYAAGASVLSYAAGTFAHSNFSVLIPVKEAGTFFVNGNMLSMGSEKVRTEFQPLGTGETFANYSLSTGLGYSQRLSQMFSIGIEIKYLQERLAQYRTGAIAADIGFLYRTDWRNLRFGVVLQHFGANSTLKGNYSPNLLQNGQEVPTEGYPAPALFKMGAQLDVVNVANHLLTAQLQLNHPNDNAENIRLGLEYLVSEMFYIRGGVKLNIANERAPVGGLGFKTNFGGSTIKIDYGISPSRFLGLYHNVGLAFYLRKSADPEPAQPAN